jgi:transcriptional regulator with XRE-family HTH domain
MFDSPLAGKTQQKKGNLNRFGRWMQTLNILLQTNMSDMAERAGVSDGAISLATHGKGGAKRETVLLLAESYRKLAEKKGVILPVAWELFFSVSWFDVGEVIDGADQSLESLEQRANLIQECNSLRKELSKEKARKEELVKENRILRRELRRLQNRDA